MSLSPHNCSRLLNCLALESTTALMKTKLLLVKLCAEHDTNAELVLECPGIQQATCGTRMACAVSVHDMANKTDIIRFSH